MQQNTKQTSNVQTSTNNLGIDWLARKGSTLTMTGPAVGITLAVRKVRLKQGYMKYISLHGISPSKILDRQNIFLNDGIKKNNIPTLLKYINFSNSQKVCIPTAKNSINCILAIF